MIFLSKESDDMIVTQLAEHQSALLAFIHSLVPGDPSAQDILQRANLVIWKKRKHFKQGTQFKSWAFSITHWEVRAYLKENKRKNWLIIDEDLTQKLSHTMTELEEEKPLSQFSSYLEQCIQVLSQSQQELLKHRYFSEQPLKIYAEKTGRPVSSLKTTLGRIRVALRKCLEARSTVQSIKQS